MLIEKDTYERNKSKQTRGLFLYKRDIVVTETLTI